MMIVDTGLGIIIKIMAINMSVKLEIGYQDLIPGMNKISLYTSLSTLLCDPLWVLDDLDGFPQ